MSVDRSLVCSLVCALVWVGGAVSCGPSGNQAAGTGAAAQGPAAAPEKAATKPGVASLPDDEDSYCVSTPTPTADLAPLLAKRAAGGAEPASMNAAPPSAEAIKQGKSLFLSYGCAACHGKEGRGDGVVARTLDPKPRNFHDPSAYKLGSSVAVVSNTISSGIPATSMPSYAQIPPEERHQIASFIVSLQKQP